MNHLNIIIKGKVQGVNFRHHTRETALSLGVTGFVENRSDGNVYIEAEGSADQLEKFCDWCRKGPSRAEVKTVDKTDDHVKNFFSFEIHR